MADPDLQKQENLKGKKEASSPAQRSGNRNRHEEERYQTKEYPRVV